jgi:hypothetical protein
VARTPLENTLVAPAILSPVSGPAAKTASATTRNTLAAHGGVAENLDRPRVG